MRDLESRYYKDNALRNQLFPLPLLWEKVVALPLEAVGGRVDTKLEVEGATIEAEVEGVQAKVEVEEECLLTLPLPSSLYGGGDCDALSISSSSSSSSSISTSFSNHSSTLHDRPLGLHPPRTRGVNCIQ